MHLHRAAIAEVCVHAESIVDSAAESIERGIAMAGGDGDLLIRQPASDFEASILGRI
jgi:hypothetical protein